MRLHDLRHTAATLMLAQAVTPREAEASVVAPGDGDVADAGPGSVRQLDLSSRRGTAKTMITGSAVEVSDEFASGGEHDRIKPSSLVGNPRVEGVIGCLGEVADVHPSMIKVEPESARVTARSLQ